jgi:membrane-associated phospholipid phosphatase
MNTFYRHALQRLIYLWWFKAIGTCAFMFLFFYVYFALLRSPVYPVWVMQTTLVDQTIPFQAVWFYAYASLWIYTSLVPALTATINKLLEYTVFISLLCGIGLMIFYFFPTSVPYKMSALGNEPLMQTLRSVDLAGNAFPSLHVASAVFSALCLHRLLVEMTAPKVINMVNTVWCCLIVYSTLAIKQHVLWDVLGGIVLALIVDAAYKRRLRLKRPR